jgi:hypothetical protein
MWAPLLALALGGCFFLDFRAWTIHEVAEYAGYLSASITRDEETLGFYFEPTPDCRAMLVDDVEVDYRKRGPLGTFEQDERTCVPIGIRRIRAWALRHPTPRNMPILPSLPANFAEIYRNDDVVLVRGNFPLSRLVYFGGGRDAVAFLPNSEVCQRYVEQGGGNMQYRRRTEEVVWLGSASDRCQILGLARPLLMEGDK